jgi:hypothetical protein
VKRVYRDRAFIGGMLPKDPIKEYSNRLRTGGVDETDSRGYADDKG